MWTTLKHQAGVNLLKPKTYRVTQLHLKVMNSGKPAWPLEEPKLP